MSVAEIYAALDDRRTLALTAWAEARRIPRTSPTDHSPVEELIAVMVVVRNRRARFAHWHAVDPSYKAICLAPWQFSCWNVNSGSNHDALMALAAQLAVQTIVRVGDFDGTPVHDVVLAPIAATLDPQLRECLTLADGVIAGTLLDRTNGATSYWAPAAMDPPGRVPTWADGLATWTIGDQVFVRAA
jgi:hypothetical protein